MPRKRMITATAQVGSDNRSRARPCSVEKLAARDAAFAGRIAALLPATAAEVADALGIAVATARHKLLDLRHARMIRSVRRAPGIRAARIYVEVCGYGR
jgi:hypothetical protein